MKTIIVLAGGKGSRMGCDKALMRLSGKTLIENAVEKMVGIADEVIVVCNNSDDIKAALTTDKAKKARVIEDLIKNKGPLEAIRTGLKQSKSFYSFIVGCDMPFLERKLIEHMLETEGFDAVVPRINGKAEPLHSVYSKNCIPAIQDLQSGPKCCIKDVFDKVKTRYLDESEIREYDKDLKSFINLNTREDLEKAELMLNEKKH